MTWAQILKWIDGVLAEKGPRVRRFPWAEGRETKPDEVEILPHGARRIRMGWVEDLP